MSHCHSTINAWHIVIGGFLQTEGRPTGMVRLWMRLHSLFSSPSSVVLLRSWNDNWSDLAELIWRANRSGQPDRHTVNIYAYSWGAGYGAMELARQLNRRGLRVHTMVLSDPVYRSPLLSFRWLALLQWSTIRVPANVFAVHWFRQNISLPAGHDLKADSPATWLSDPKWVEVDHQYMDDWRPFHNECERVAANA